MRLKIVALAFAVALLITMAVPLFSVGTAEAIVHPAVPICEALSHAGEAGGGPAFPLPDEAKSGAGGPGAVAQGAEKSGENSPAAPVRGEGCP